MGKYYLNNREIVGDDDLSKCWLGPENLILQSSQYDSIFVCETFSEAMDEIRNTLACFIKFYDRFAFPHEMTVWIAKDAELEYAKKYLGKRYEDYLGEWKYNEYFKLSREIKSVSNRTFIIRRHWLPKMQELIFDL